MADAHGAPPDCHDPSDCNVRMVLDRVSDKWTLYVVSMLADGELRFSELRRRIPAISQRMLTVTLRGLERDGLVERRIYAVMPPHIGYSLTPLGQRMRMAIGGFFDWARAEWPAIQEAQSAYDARQDAEQRGDVQRVPITTPTS